MRNLIRLPSLSDTRSTSPRSASRSADSCRAFGETPVGARNSPNSALQRVAPFAGRDARLGRLDRSGHDVDAARRRHAQRPQRLLDPLVIAAGAPGLEACDLLRLGFGRGNHDRALARGQRGRLGIHEGVDADDDLLAALDRLEPAGVRFDQASLEDAGFDRADRAAHRVDRRDLGQRLGLERLDQGRDFLAAVEQVAEFQKIGLIGHDLLQPERPLLVERPRQAERLVPGGQLHRARPRAARKHDRQHFDQDAVGVVFRLLLGQARAS